LRGAGREVQQAEGYDQAKEQDDAEGGEILRLTRVDRFTFLWSDGVGYGAGG